ncbi:hypothetical protein Sjap_022083 [Stephania japonica]|uniref:Uncharacterized protein n=1 Tax=Stephania japonica TaxID=461633 RepID=A0AAP0HU35_9MAGN
MWSLSVGANRVSIFMGSAIAVCSFAFFIFFFMFFFINLGKEEEPSSRNLILAGTVIGLSLGSHLSTLKAKGSPMRLPAESFLTLRTFGAPAVVYVAREKNGIYILRDRYVQEETEKKAMAEKIEQMELDFESKGKAEIERRREELT